MALNQEQYEFMEPLQNTIFVGVDHPEIDLGFPARMLQIEISFLVAINLLPFFPDHCTDSSFGNIQLIRIFFQQRGASWWRYVVAFGATFFILFEPFPDNGAYIITSFFSFRLILFLSLKSSI